MEQKNIPKIQILNLLKNNSGAVLIWALIVFVFLSILTGSVAYIARQNIYEVRKQEERLQAHYIALAGVDLTYAALMQLNGERADKKIDDENIIRQIRNAQGGKRTQKIDIKTGNPKTLKGTANVTITIEKSGKPETEWLVIRSEGQLEKENAIVVPSTMKINTNNFDQIIRER